MIESDGALPLTVLKREVAAQGVVTLHLAHAAGLELPVWSPGAHVDVMVPDGRPRQYSLCGDPADRTTYRISVLREMEGLGSRWVHDDVVEGQPLEGAGPRNHFELHPASAYVFIAGGIGITPLLPMLRAATAAGAQWVLHYGGRTRASMAHVEELESWGDSVRVLPEDESGLLPLAEMLGVPREGVLVYCCGPGALIDAVENAMAGWPAGALHVERFAPPADADFSRDSEFDVRCDDSDITVRVTRGQSIVEALAAVGVEVTTSCGEGTCGTCETDVIDGLPDHRDSVLTEAEREANELIMPCCSRSLSDLLVLDL